MSAPNTVEMPEEPTPEALKAITGRFLMSTGSAEELYHILYAHLAKPLTDAPRKMTVTAWAQVAPTGDIRSLTRSRDMLLCVKHGRTEISMRDVIVELTGAYEEAPEPARSRTVETWEVRYAVHCGGGWMASGAVYSSRAQCEEFQRNHPGPQYSCWSIVGPIERVIPA